MSVFGARPVLHVQSPTLSEGTVEALQSVLFECGFLDAKVELVDEISGFFDRKRNLVY